jgi:hypothetical protein
MGENTMQLKKADAFLNHWTILHQTKWKGGAGSPLSNQSKFIRTYVWLLSMCGKKLGLVKYNIIKENRHTP